MARKDMKKKFRVIVPEVYISHYIVDAISPKEALEKRRQGHGYEELNGLAPLTRFDHALPFEQWIVEKVED